tara:strand:+ start:122 stop:787 length:666 start_codon:yes stop_codon:yes gene_type:complete
MSEKEREIFKLKILQARYLKAQLAMDEKTFEEAQFKFAKAYHEICKTCPAHEREILEGAMEDPEKKKSNVSKAAQKAKEQNNKEPEPEPEIPDPEPIKKETQSESVKKIYRAIAVKSHPDKMVGLPEEIVNEKETLFKDAKTAIEKNDFLGLYDVARELGIEVPEPEQGQIEMLKRTIKNINNQIKQMKDTTAWQWHREKDPHRKEAILVTYMQYVYTKFR